MELLQELANLREAGFDPDTVAVFMADRHKKAMQAVEVFQDRYRAIQDQMKPKPRSKKTEQYRPANWRCASSKQNLDNSYASYDYSESR